MIMREFIAGTSLLRSHAIKDAAGFLNAALPKVPSPIGDSLREVR
jgi:hypothetical protein